LTPHDQPEPDAGKAGSRFYTALACYAAIALLAGFTLDGKFRLVVWIFLAGLAARTYLHTLRKP
jgi:hypothetical protein